MLMLDLYNIFLDLVRLTSCQLSFTVDIRPNLDTTESKVSGTTHVLLSLLLRRHIKEPL